MKIMKYLFVMFFSQITICIFFAHSYALETVTHENINVYIARNSLNGFSLDSYLKDQLGIQGGIEESFNSYKVWRWLGKGGVYEDIPEWYMLYLRSVNHFHNPLETDLSEAGYTGIWGTGVLSGDSSIVWSQKPLETQDPGGHYSWHDVRDYFHKALTATDNATREEKFAETFRALGQLMHLVQDLSVPAHTRDDGHVFYNYETWVIENLEYERISNYPPIYFDKLALGNSNPLASVPIANLFDTNQYVGSNPDITLRPDIGLSEYTNCNFLSSDTTFTDPFPYPAWSSVQITDYEIKDPRDPSRNVLRQYHKKVNHGDTGYRLAGAPFLEDYKEECAPFCDELLYELAFLDNEVYGDYAERLIPRAVGYSAGLLEYFFRAILEVQFVDGGMEITNRSEETMHDGYFELYYENAQGQRYSISIISGSEVTALGPNTAQTIEFDFPQDVLFYTVVYRGGLGNETDAVVGKSKVSEIFTVYPLTAGFVNLQVQEASWVETHDAVTGTQADQTLLPYFFMLSSRNDNWCNITRGFISFDLTSLPTTGRITSVELELFPKFAYNYPSSVSVQEGTQSDYLSILDYNSFAGSSFGNTSWITTDWNTITFNTAGIDYLDTFRGNGTVKLCVREYTHDYLNIDPYPLSYSNSASKDPGYEPRLIIKVE